MRGFGWVGSCFHVVLLVLHRRLDTSKPRPECRVVWWRGRRGQDALKPPNGWGATFRGWARGTQPECWFRQGSRARRQTHNPLFHLALGALCSTHFLPTSAPPMLTMLFTSFTTMGLFLGGSCIGGHIVHSEKEKENAPAAEINAFHPDSLSSARNDTCLQLRRCLYPLLHHAVKTGFSMQSHQRPDHRDFEYPWHCFLLRVCRTARVARPVRFPRKAR